MIDEAPPEPRTTRVAGSVSARLVALAVAGVLVGVVGFTAMNRPPQTPAPSPSAATVALAPTGAPSAAPSPHQLDGNDGVIAGLGIRGVHVRRTPVEPAYDYAVSTQIPGGRLRVALSGSVTVYGGSFVIDDVDLGQTLTLDVDRGWTELGVHVFETVDVWPIEIQPLLKSHGKTLALLVAHGPTSPIVASGSTAAPLDYTFVVLGRHVRHHISVQIELVWPTAAPTID